MADVLAGVPGVAGEAEEVKGFAPVLDPALEGEQPESAIAHAQSVTADDSKRGGADGGQAAQGGPNCTTVSLSPVSSDGATSTAVTPVAELSVWEKQRVKEWTLGVHNNTLLSDGIFTFPEGYRWGHTKLDPKAVKKLKDLAR